MTLRERLVSRLIGSPLQRPAEGLRWLKGLPHRLAHPELGEVFAEGARIDRFLRQVVGPGTNCVDVGCHLGVFLQRIVALSPGGTHVAVEPVPYKAEWLRAKFPQVQVLAVGLAAESGDALLALDRAESAYSGLRRHAHSARHGLEQVPVPVRRLDDVVPPDLRIGFVKVDVNGGELGVLRGGAGLIRAHRPAMLLELTAEGHAAYGVTPAETLDFIEAGLGYRLFLLKDHFTGGPPLGLAAFERSMRYPFQAFDFVALPGT